jgi:hypothetical protein
MGLRADKKMTRRCAIIGSMDAPRSGEITSRRRSPMKKIIAAIVLAAMIAPTHADDDLGKVLMELLEALHKLDRSWLGTALRYDDPKSWNGVWPKSGWVLPKSEMTIYSEPGGVIKEHIDRWQELARSGDDVEILDACYSACTLIVAYVPKERLCFGAFATLQFHLAWNRETGKPSLDVTEWMLKQYPREIYDWIMERGGIANMTIPTFMELRAPSLWRMGYRQCRRDQ